MILVDPVILSITEQKMRVQLDEFYAIALALKECAHASKRIGDPFTKEGVSLYAQYIELTDDLYKCYNSLIDYFSLISAYTHDKVL